MQVTQLLPGSPPCLGALCCTKAGPAAAGSSARSLCHTQTPGTSSLIDVLLPRENPASFPDTLSLTVLQLRLQQRRTREQLADQGIMPREYLFLPFSPTPGSEGLCSSWALLGHRVASAACSDPLSSEQIATRGYFASCPVEILWSLVLYNCAQHLPHRL